MDIVFQARAEDQTFRMAYQNRPTLDSFFGKQERQLSELERQLRTKTEENKGLQAKLAKATAEEKEMKHEIGILKFKLEEEKKRSQELLNQKTAADAKTQQLENEARNKDTRIIELERKIKNSEAVAHEIETLSALNTDLQKQLEDARFKVSDTCDTCVQVVKS